MCLLRDHNDIINSCLLLEAGYSLHKDHRLIDDLLPKLNPESELYKYLIQEMYRVSSLLFLCRTVIRGAIGGVKLQKKLENLSLPLLLVTYLQLNAETHSTVLINGKLKIRTE